MIFSSDGPAQLALLVSCWKRAVRFASPGPIDRTHLLAPAWMNCVMFLDARPSGPRPKRENKLWNHKRREAAAGAFDINCLTWFAARVDAFAADHILSGDPTVAAMLHAWRLRMPFDPTKLVKRSRPLEVS